MTEIEAKRWDVMHGKMGAVVRWSAMPSIMHMASAEAPSRLGFPSFGCAESDSRSPQLKLAMAPE